MAALIENHHDNARPRPTPPTPRNDGLRDAHHGTACRAAMMIFAVLAALSLLLLCSTVTQNSNSAVVVVSHHGNYRNQQDDRPVETPPPLRRNRQLRRLESLQSCPSGPSILDNRPEPSLPRLLPDQLLQKSTYAASFPGSGHKLLTKRLVESITGMLAGEASTSPSLERMKVQKMDHTGFARGQGEVVVLRTSFPHSSGHLSAWDEFVPRAFVLLRNPLSAMPRYFDQLYEMKSHLPSSGPSAIDPEETRLARIKWRDNELENQLLQYRRFVSFWMEKFLGNDEARVYFSYEGLVDRATGAEEALRLALFLEGGARASALEVTTPEDLGSIYEGPESIDLAVTTAIRSSFASVEEVPCLWNEIVDEAAADWSPSDRPYTPENLAAISAMLLELMNRWSRHQRLLSILSGYHQEVINLVRVQGLLLGNEGSA